MKQKLIAKIHVIKNKSSLDEDTYRDILVRVTGRNSTKSMGVKQLLAVVDEFVSLGYASKTRASNTIYTNNKFKYVKTDCTLMRKIFKMWCELGDTGVIKDNSNKVLDSFLIQKFGTSINTLNSSNNTELKNKVIEGLKNWLNRSIKKVGV